MPGFLGFCIFPKILLMCNFFQKFVHESGVILPKNNPIVYVRGALRSLQFQKNLGGLERPANPLAARAWLATLARRSAITAI